MRSQPPFRRLYDDAYVRTDCRGRARSDGLIVALYVHDNQPIRKGDPLFTIDPVPFRLIVDQKQAEIDEAKAQIVADQQAISVAEDQHDAATSAVTFAKVTQQRFSTLTLRLYAAGKPRPGYRRAEARARQPEVLPRRPIAQAR